ncbi:MAG TPA: hypothetical protein VFT22_01570 [Kofleriaceae bacterium]|nr:hypothetical protein [Kofleriaceae bacterium]
MAAGCYTTTNVATMGPLHTAYPVSASSQYVDHDGSIVTESAYEVVQPFAFHRSIEGRPLETTVTDLALQPELDRIMSTAAGDAVTAMKIEATGYDQGAHGPAAGLKLLGWTCGVGGAAVIALGVAAGEQEGSSLTRVGVVVAGLGVVSYVIGAVLKTPARWSLDVSGRVVRRTSAVKRAGMAAARAAR